MVKISEIEEEKETRRPKLVDWQLIWRETVDWSLTIVDWSVAGFMGFGAFTALTREKTIAKQTKTYDLTPRDAYRQDHVVGNSTDGHPRYSCTQGG